MTLFILRSLCGAVAALAAIRFVQDGDGAALALAIGAPVAGVVAG